MLISNKSTRDLDIASAEKIASLLLTFGMISAPSSSSIGEVLGSGTSDT